LIIPHNSHGGQFDQKHLDLISRIYDLPLRPEGWPAVLDEFASIIGAGITGVVAFDPIYVDHHLNAASSNFTPALLEEQNNRFSANSGYRSAFAKMAANPRHAFIDDLEMLGIDSLEVYGQRPNVQWLSEKLGVFHGMASCLNLHKAWSDILFVMFPKERGPATDREKKIGYFFLEHFAKTVEIGRSFTVLQNRFNGVFASLDRLHIGVFLLSATGSIAHQNNEARRILDAGDGILLSHGGYMHPTDEGSREALKDAISKAAATAQARHNCAETLLTLPRSSGKDPYLVEVSPLRGNDEFASQFSGCLVFVIDPTKTDVVSTEGMQELYQLTGAESEVCRLVAEGLETGDIADTRNITRETVRNCIKQILHKTGVGNRSQLVRLALRVNLPIDPAPGGK
jgi:DNA-binding CsgD family transcriptional regulator